MSSVQLYIIILVLLYLVYVSECVYLLYYIYYYVLYLSRDTSAFTNQIAMTVLCHVLNLYTHIIRVHVQCACVRDSFKVFTVLNVLRFSGYYPSCSHCLRRLTFTPASQRLVNQPLRLSLPILKLLMYNR